MKRHHMPDSHQAHPNVTPLIDIVMCLIIFFMLVAKIGVNTGADAEIKIPTSMRGVDIKDMGNTLVLNVKPGIGREPMVTALVPGKGGKVEELKLIDQTSGRRPLFDTLSYFRYGADGKPNTKDDNDQFKVIIRGEQEMAYSFLEPVLVICGEANVHSVNFNTRKVMTTEAVE
jgi:biopolymer transport protein ExbD